MEEEPQKTPRKARKPLTQQQLDHLASMREKALAKRRELKQATLDQQVDHEVEKLKKKEQKPRAIRSKAKELAKQKIADEKNDIELPKKEIKKHKPKSEPEPEPQVEYDSPPEPPNDDEPPKKPPSKKKEKKIKYVVEESSDEEEIVYVKKKKEPKEERKPRYSDAYNYPVVENSPIQPQPPPPPQSNMFRQPTRAFNFYDRYR